MIDSMWWFAQVILAAGMIAALAALALIMCCILTAALIRVGAWAIKPVTAARKAREEAMTNKWRGRRWPPGMGWPPPPMQYGLRRPLNQQVIQACKINPSDPLPPLPSKSKSKGGQTNG